MYIYKYTNSINDENYYEMKKKKKRRNLNINKFKWKRK